MKTCFALSLGFILCIYSSWLWTWLNSWQSAAGAADDCQFWTNYNQSTHSTLVQSNCVIICCIKWRSHRLVFRHGLIFSAIKKTKFKGHWPMQKCFPNNALNTGNKFAFLSFIDRSESGSLLKCYSWKSLQKQRQKNIAKGTTDPRVEFSLPKYQSNLFWVQLTKIPN